MDILKKVLDTINKYSMLSEGDSVLLGLSGGPDSICLARILHKLKVDFNLTLNAVYIDHALRPGEVVREKAFCKNFCDTLGIGFFWRSVDLTKDARNRTSNIQEAARELRYGVYEEISGEIRATKIALGHTADDQAETFLMRLLRGSGSRGLSGIPPVRGKIIRPLIEIERIEIEDFLASDLHAQYMVDSSNLKTDYFRNWIRQKVFPELKKKNPSLLKTFCRAADILREEDAYLELIVTKTLMKLISRKSEHTVELFLSPLKTMQKPILRRVLRRVFHETAGLRGIDFVHVEDIIELIRNGKTGDRISLPKGVKVFKSYATLVLTTELPKKLQLRKFNPPGKLLLDEVSIVLAAEISEKLEKPYNGKDTAVFDVDKLTFPLQVRGRKKGDYFYPLHFGKRKKLQDFFVDIKIPRDERDAVPVVLSDDNILWIAGYRMDERFKANEETKKFLIISRFKV